VPRTPLRVELRQLGNLVLARKGHGVVTVVEVADSTMLLAPRCSIEGREDPAQAKLPRTRHCRDSSASIFDSMHHTGHEHVDPDLFVDTSTRRLRSNEVPSSECRETGMECSSRSTRTPHCPSARTHLQTHRHRSRRVLRADASCRCTPPWLCQPISHAQKLLPRPEIRLQVVPTIGSGRRPFLSGRIGPRRTPYRCLAAGRTR